VIAVLIGILLPALAKARAAGRAAGCLSNLHQVVAAWTVYAGDYDNWPVGGGPVEYRPKVRLGWGGVHWYGYDGGGQPVEPTVMGDDGEPTFVIPAARPINPYLGEAETIEATAKVFKCPGDTGVRIEIQGNIDPWAEIAKDSRAGEPTVFGQLGTSYEANRWLYFRPKDGMEGEAVWSPGQGPRNVVGDPSRLVVAGDSGTMRAGEVKPATWPFVILGWWHARGSGNFGFMDGSARGERLVDPTLRSLVRPYSYSLLP
jgi:hypothetical protein